MGVLHVIRRSPTEGKAWDRCLERMAAGDALLLVADAVYAVGEKLVNGRVGIGEIQVYALLPDMLARGVGQGELGPWVRPIGFDGFVDLTLVYERVLTW